MEKFCIPAVRSDPVRASSRPIKSTGFLNGGRNYHTLLCCISMPNALYISFVLSCHDGC